MYIFCRSKRIGVSFSAIENFYFEKNKKMYFSVFLKHYLRCTVLSNMKLYTFIQSYYPSKDVFFSR